DSANSPVREPTGHARVSLNEESLNSEQNYSGVPKRSEVREAKAKDDSVDDFPASLASFASK
ncbi:hypothetical protein DYB32_005191, partial [Aphanomyces invadans]